MGSTGCSEPSALDEMTVLVTGFDAFKENFPINPSWEIARRLPPYLPPLRAKAPATTPHSGIPLSSAPSSAPAHPPVRILVHPSPVRVAYPAVRSLVPDLWAGASVPELGGAGGRRIDAVVHLGMAGPRLHYCVEKAGHRDGYHMPDVDGGLLGDEARRERLGDGWVWHGCPAVLETELELEDVLRRWKGHSPDNMDLRISTDAGHFLCDFIYYSSLAHLWKAGEHRRVVFLHVPSASSEGAIATGREVCLQLIRSICESERSRPKKAL